MAKRFTDTDKYKKPFLRGLQGAYKLLWDYICNDCNYAGIWIVDFEIAQIYLGQDMKVNKEDALKVFNADKKRIIEFENGSRWFIVSFIEFQYGILNPQNRAHSSVISCLKNSKLHTYHNDVIKPLISPLQGAKDKDKDKEKDKEKDKGGGGGKLKIETFDFSIVPISYLDTVKKWIDYKTERRESYKPKGFDMMVKKLIDYSENNPTTATEIIESAMSKNYSGFFKLKNNGTATTITGAGSAKTAKSERDSEFAAHIAAQLAGGKG